MEITLTDEQIEQQEHVEESIHTMLNEVAGRKLMWDDAHHSLIGAIRDLISDEFSAQGIIPAVEFYPFIESEQGNWTKEGF